MTYPFNGSYLRLKFVEKWLWFTSSSRHNSFCVPSFKFVSLRLRLGQCAERRRSESDGLVLSKLYFARVASVSTVFVHQFCTGYLLGNWGEGVWKTNSGVETYRSKAFSWKSVKCGHTSFAFFKFSFFICLHCCPYTSVPVSCFFSFAFSLRTVIGCNIVIVNPFHIYDWTTTIFIKITISSIVIGLKNSHLSVIHLPSCYRTVCYWKVYY